jgi:hypothetical protein
VASFNELAEWYTPAARLVVVYIAEAHADDVWPISSSFFAPGVVSVRRHRSMAERIEAARRLWSTMAELGIPFHPAIELVVDGMDDAIGKTLGAWPLRFYVARSGCMRHVALPTRATYDIAAVRRALEDAMAE